MKNYFYFIFLIFFVSCNNDYLVDKHQEEELNSFNSLKSATLSDLDLTGIPVNILLVGGISTNCRYLSSYPDGTKLNIWGTDDMTGRQRWIFSKTADGYYNISIYGGISNLRRYLSSYPDGTTVDLYPRDEGSGRQRWSLIDIGNNTYNIKIKDGCVSGGRKYLSTYPNGSKIDLFTAADYTGRQQWNIEPAGDFELLSVTYYLDPLDVITSRPDFICYAYVSNLTSTTQTLSVNFSNKATESSNFTKTLGLSYKLGAQVKVSVPFIMEDKISVEYTSSATWSYGTSESREDTKSYNFSLNAAPYQKIEAKAIVSIQKLNAHYEATYKSVLNGKIKKVIGIWEGVQTSDVRYEIRDVSSGQLLKSIAATPPSGSVINLN